MEYCIQSSSMNESIYLKYLHQFIGLSFWLLFPYEGDAQCHGPSFDTDSWW